MVKDTFFEGLKWHLLGMALDGLHFLKQIKIETNVLLRHKGKHSEITGAQSEKLGRESVSLFIRRSD